MDLQTARAVFEQLESARFNEDGRFNDDLENPESEWNPPTFDVRLDAVTGRENDEREFRIRVTPGGSTGGLDGDDWLAVLNLASEHELRVDVQNAGLDLR